MRLLLTRRFQSTARPNCFIERLTGPHQGISVLTLNRPEARNALSQSLLANFNSCVDEIIKESPAGPKIQETRVLVIRSVVEGVFCAGADLKERAGMNEQETEQFVSNLKSSFSRIEQLKVPTIAALDGAALGGGLELALCCDIRYASQKVQIGLPETRLAIIPGAGGTVRLPRLVGISKAKELIFAGKILNSQEALQIGLVNQVSADETAYQHALKVASQILANGPVAVKSAKYSIDAGSRCATVHEALKIESSAYKLVLKTQDRLEGLASFREKRKPLYRGE